MKYHDLDQRVSEYMQYGAILSAAMVTPQKFEIAPEHAEYLPAVFSEMTDTAIVKVDPLFHVGRVYKFNVLPHRQPDPEILWVRDMKLSAYYYKWGMWVRGELASCGREELNKSVNGTIRDTITEVLPVLDEEEIHYLLANLFAWKLEMRMKR